MQPSEAGQILFYALIAWKAKRISMDTAIAFHCNEIGIPEFANETIPVAVVYIKVSNDRLTSIDDIATEYWHFDNWGMNADKYFSSEYEADLAQKELIRSIRQNLMRPIQLNSDVIDLLPRLRQTQRNSRGDWVLTHKAVGSIVEELLKEFPQHDMPCIDTVVQHHLENVCSNKSG